MALLCQKGVDMPKGMEMMYKIFGDTVQLYTTSRCGMNCPHCKSRLQIMPDMSLQTFEYVVMILRSLGVQRIEIFANDGLLHPQIRDQIRILNESGMGYALLTVGASPKGPRVGQLFSDVLTMIHDKRGGVVFSVDCAKETSQRESPENPYAFKARVFWELTERLQAEGVNVRTNTVISRNNVGEVVPIIRRVAEMGFAASFCFVQYTQPEFDAVSREGLGEETEQEFRQYMHESDLLASGEIDEIVTASKKILSDAALSAFNTFRGDDSKEGEIPPARLAKLRKELLCLKSELGDAIVLPGESFISGIGDTGFGCLGLLQQGRFPQMKIGAKGQIIFCCDLNDTITSSFHIRDLTAEEGRKAFLEAIRTNPYIWVCTHFNPCAFSVNYVQFAT